MKGNAFMYVLSAALVVSVVPFAAATGESDVAADEPVTITMWVQNYNGTESPIEEISAMFTELYAQAEEMFNVDIVEEYQLGYGEYRDKLVATAQADALPEIVSVDNSWFPEMIRLGALQPLDDFWPELDRADFFPGTISHAVGPDGKIYALWFWTDTYLIYYRTDLFAAAGIDPLPVDRALTWDEFTEIAAKLSTDGVTGFMFPAARWAGASTGMLGDVLGPGRHDVRWSRRFRARPTGQPPSHDRRAAVVPRSDLHPRRIDQGVGRLAGRGAATGVPGRQGSDVPRRNVAGRGDR